MFQSGRRRLLLVLAASIGLLAAKSARAAIPATYAGTAAFGGQTCTAIACTPQRKGMPTEIPGRLEFENVDLGGYGVAFKVDHYDNTVSGADYRPGEKIPNVCCLNCKGIVDKYPDGGIYPSSANPHGYYIGWAHPVDWTKFTVNVLQGGMYKVTTTVASQPATIQISLWSNDVRKIPDAASTTPFLKLPGTNNYHIWAYFELGTIQLDAGLQVIQFKLEGQPHLQYDYLQFDLLSDDGGVVGGGNGGATSSDASGVVDDTGAPAGPANSSSADGGADSPFDEPLDSATGGLGGGAGSPSGSGSSPNNGAAPAYSSQGPSGCGCSTVDARGSGAAVGVGFLAVWLAVGRRRSRGCA
jgi:hypothetical protein